MKRIGIIGSRRRAEQEDFDMLVNCIKSIYEDGDIFVSGGCKTGGDRFGEILAERMGILDSMIIHLPDKSALPENPKRWDFAKINFDRNTLIARDSDVLVAIVAPDRKGGTEDTIKKFKKMYPLKEVILI